MDVLDVDILQWAEPGFSFSSFPTHFLIVPFELGFRDVL